MCKYYGKFKDCYIDNGFFLFLLTDSLLVSFLAIQLEDPEFNSDWRSKHIFDHTPRRRINLTFLSSDRISILKNQKQHSDLKSFILRYQLTWQYDVGAHLNTRWALLYADPFIILGFVCLSKFMKHSLAQMRPFMHEPLF